MRIKMRTNYGNYGYYTVKDCEARDYSSNNKTDFYFFVMGSLFSYDHMPYHFATIEDAVKVVEDIYAEEAAGNLVIYDLDKKLAELNITTSYCN